MDDEQMREAWAYVKRFFRLRREDGGISIWPWKLDRFVTDEEATWIFEMNEIYGDDD